MLCVREPLKISACVHIHFKNKNMHRYPTQAEFQRFKGLMDLPSKGRTIGDLSLSAAIRANNINYVKYLVDVWGLDPTLNHFQLATHLEHEDLIQYLKPLTRKRSLSIDSCLSERTQRLEKVGWGEDAIVFPTKEQKKDPEFIKKHLLLINNDHITDKEDLENCVIEIEGKQYHFVYEDSHPFGGVLCWVHPEDAYLSLADDLNKLGLNAMWWKKFLAYQDFQYQFWLDEFPIN